MKKNRSPIFIIFTTVALDLIGFGMVIPLIGLYGRNTGASPGQLALLGGIFSIMQFIFAPLWGRLSDRVGRRPILLMSLVGASVSYAVFGFAESFAVLLLSRAMSGVFAANISTAHAYIADVTAPENRAKGMGMIGAAFGIGFTLGPPLGGIAAKHFGLGAPGYLAAAICGLNAIWAYFRLPESLPRERRARAPASRTWLTPIQSFRHFTSPGLKRCLLTMFFSTLAFSTMEQVFSLLIQSKFSLDTREAGYRTGLILAFAGVIGALIQGGLIRSLVPKFGERRLLLVGIVGNMLGMFLFPFMPAFAWLFFAVLPIAIGSALVNPSLSSLTSKNASPTEQGAVFGVSSGLGSLARACGPMLGLFTFSMEMHLPFLIAALISMGLLLGWMLSRKTATGFLGSSVGLSMILIALSLGGIGCGIQNRDDAVFAAAKTSGAPGGAASPTGQVPAPAATPATAPEIDGLILDAWQVSGVWSWEVARATTPQWVEARSCDDAGSCKQRWRLDLSDSLCPLAISTSSGSMSCEQAPSFNTSLSRLTQVTSLTVITPNDDSGAGFSGLKSEVRMGISRGAAWTSTWKSVR